MTDRQALRRAIIENPDEDTPRLAFADWLDEHGDERDRYRARFIRVQCGMACTEEQHPAWRKLFAEQAKMQKAMAWEPDHWPKHLEKRATSFDYERGFVAALTVHAKRFLAEAEKFYADDPIQRVKFVKLTARQGSVPPEELFGSPHLARLRALDLTGSGVGDAILGLIATSPHLAGLRTLVLSENSLSTDGLGRLIDSRSLPALTHLDLNRSSFPADEGVRAMVTRPGFRRIRSLDLFMTGITLAGVRAVAESPHAAGLERLRLGAPDWTVRWDESNDVAATAMAEAVANSPHLARLKELDLSWRRIGLEGLKAIARSPHLKSLRRLSLRRCAFPAPAAKVVAESPNLKGLYLLELGVQRDRFTKTQENLVREALPEAAVRFE
ncbi:MAG TPA: TIGR02996 domain-containing protein [Gemmataceae bacterium]|nr:TIGR02996 domain-containing protein [Gemmataceae bacterium]